MKLFEATDGTVGFSYLRSYIWAVDKDQAKTLAGLTGLNITKIKLRELMDGHDKPFYTEPSDEGWERS